MYKITYYTRKFIDNYKCIDIPVTTTVLSDKPAFISGDLFYFKKDRFNYLPLYKGSKGKYYKWGNLWIKN